MMAKKKRSPANKDGVPKTLDPEDMAEFHQQFLHENRSILKKYDR